MNSKNLLTDFLWIGILLCVQIFVLNRITIFGQYTPVIYPIFVLFYSFFRNQYQFLALSFLLGLSVDAFMGTWGINAFATTCIAYFRTILFRHSTDNTTDFFSFASLQWSQFLFFIFSSIILHQFLVQILELFKLSQLLALFVDTLVSALISFTFILIYSLLFKVKQNV